MLLLTVHVALGGNDGRGRPERCDRSRCVLEPWLRLGIFVTSISLLKLAERLWPRRPGRPVRGLRANIALLLANTLVGRIVTTSSLVGLAVAVQAMHSGLLARINAPGWLEIGLAVGLLDVSVDLQHRLYHWIPWRVKARAEETYPGALLDRSRGRFDPSIPSPTRQCVVGLERPARAEPLRRNVRTLDRVVALQRRLHRGRSSRG